MKLGPRSARAVSLLIGLLAGLLLCEAAVRLLVPRGAWRLNQVGETWAPDPRLGWRLKGGLDVDYRDEGETVTLRTNPDGLLPPSAIRARRPGVRRVMLVGDSTTIGRSVKEPERLHAQLERSLARLGQHVEVLNAGVDLYSTDQALLLMEEILPIYQPDLVVYTVCINDFGGNVSSKVFRTAKPVFIRDGKGGFVEVPPPAQEPFDPSLASGFSAAVQHSALYRLLQPVLFRVRARFRGWEERNLLGLADEFYWDPHARELCDWELFRFLVRRMAQSSTRHGARLVLTSHPALEEVWRPYIARIRHELGARGTAYDTHALQKALVLATTAEDIPFCPVIDEFLAHQERGPFHLLPRDSHCNAAGYQTFGLALAPCVSRQLAER